MTEVELKAALTEALAGILPDRLAALGFVPGETVRETDLYFNGGDRDFRRTDEALRLRRVSSGREENVLLTYKGPKEDPRSNTRREYETTAGDPDTLRAILGALGFQPVFTVDKERRTYLRDGVTACLDQVEGLGSYLELERLLPDSGDRDAAVDGLLALLEDLGVSRRALEHRSYLELLMAPAQEA